MQERQYGYVRGNTAIAPERKQRTAKTNKRKNSILRKHNKQKALAQSKKNDRKYMFVIVASIFTLGCMTIAGDTKVYNMQREVTKMSSTIKNMKEENEALKVKILKYSSLSNIEGNASAKLGMYIPSTEDVVKIDFSENYFKDIDTVESTAKNGKNIFSKIADIFK